jgi:dihydroorotate dehydrogenase
MATLVGVGGIQSAEDAYAMIGAGANLLQLYTGLVYRGPMLIRDILQGLLLHLEQDGFKNIPEAVGWSLS